MRQGEKFWEFRTRNFRIVADALPEDTNPADSFDDEETVQDIRDGVYTWFCARVSVFGPDGCELATDYLGGCAYKSLDEFATAHRDPDPMNRNCSLMRGKHPAGPSVVIGHYFPDMVREAVREARKVAREVAPVYSSLRKVRP